MVACFPSPFLLFYFSFSISMWWNIVLWTLFRFKMIWHTCTHKKIKAQFWVIGKENERLLLILVWTTGMINGLFLKEYRRGYKEPLSWKSHSEQAHQKQKAFPSSLSTRSYQQKEITWKENHTTMHFHPMLINPWSDIGCVRLIQKH